MSEEQAAKTKTFLPFSDEQLAELEEAHRKIEVVRGAPPPPRRWVPNDDPEPPWEAVFRIPTAGEFEFFEQHMAGDQKSKAAAVRSHAKATVVAVSINGKQTVCLNSRDTVSVREVRRAWDGLREAGNGGAHMAAQDSIMSLASMGRDEVGKD